MNELTIIKRNNTAYIDSREVAEIIGKRHDNLLRDIGKYRKIIYSGGLLKIEESDFFIESSYLNGQNKEMPCYLISRKGADVIANKLTGEKGVLFTAAYVTRFHELEAAERAEFKALAETPAPRLGEYNACARIIMRGLKWLGASPEQIMRFLKNTYEPLGITVDVGLDENCGSVPRWYKASEIAEVSGMYSLYGKPHAQAAACILNEIIPIAAENKRMEAEDYGNHTNIRILYNSVALGEAILWLIDNDWPDEIYGFARTYHVQYPHRGNGIR